MFVSKEFRGLKELKRDGLALSVVLPEIVNPFDCVSLKIDTNTCKVIIENDDKAGNAIILASKIGVRKNSKVSIEFFFVEKGVLIELKEGVLFIEDGNGFYGVCNEDGIVYSDNKDDMIWLTSDELYTRMSSSVGYKFGLEKNKNKVKEYVDNLIYSTIIEHQRAGNIFRFQTFDYSTSISMGNILFESKEDADSYDSEDTDSDDSDDVYDGNVIIPDCSEDMDDDDCDSDEDDSDEDDGVFAG